MNLPNRLDSRYSRTTTWKNHGPIASIDVVGPWFFKCWCRLWEIARTYTFLKSLPIYVLIFSSYFSKFFNLLFLLCYCIHFHFIIINVIIINVHTVAFVATMFKVQIICIDSKPSNPSILNEVYHKPGLLVGEFYTFSAEVCSEVVVTVVLSCCGLLAEVYSAPFAKFELSLWSKLQI